MTRPTDAETLCALQRAYEHFWTLASRARTGLKPRELVEWHQRQAEAIKMVARERYQVDWL